jgi:hypothetical protein
MPGSMRAAKRRRWRRRAAGIGLCGIILFAGFGVWQAARFGEARRSTTEISGTSLTRDRCVQEHAERSLPSTSWLLITRACEELARAPSSSWASCVLGREEKIPLGLNDDLIAKECEVPDWPVSIEPKGAQHPPQKGEIVYSSLRIREQGRGGPPGGKFFMSDAEICNLSPAMLFRRHAAGLVVEAAAAGPTQASTLLRMAATLLSEAERREPATGSPAA